jgi:DNA polymerase III beta subunit, C-terminal domain
MIFDNDKLHRTIGANPILRFPESSAHGLLHQLRPKISRLVTHEVITINTLSESPGSGLCPTGSQNFSRLAVFRINRIKSRAAEVPAVKLELSHSPVSIKTENDGTANSVALEHTRISGKARDIGFNLQYLTQYVKSLETDTISMNLFSKAICEVALFDAFRYQHLLMPLRV